MMQKRLVAVLAIGGVLTTGMLTYHGMQKTIVLQDQGVKKVYKTFSHTVEDFLKDQGIQVAKEDEINMELQAALQKNNELTIERAVKITLEVNGEKREVKSAAKTVRELLEDENIGLNEKDVLQGIQPDTSIEEGLNIVVDKYKEEEIKETEEIPFTVEKKNSDTLPRGTVKVVQDGKTGVKEKVLKVTYIGNKEIKREELSSKTLQEPTKRVEEVGTAIMVATSRGEVRAKRMLVMRATGYTASYADTGKRPGDPGFGITASGMKARVGVVAVDPKVIPLGTKLYVEGYGSCVAGDTGGAIKGNKIDLYFNSTQEALRFGVRTKNVYILE